MVLQFSPESRGWNLMGNHKSVQRPTKCCISQGCALDYLVLTCRTSHDSAQSCWKGPLTPQSTFPRMCLLGPLGMITGLIIAKEQLCPCLQGAYVQTHAKHRDGETCTGPQRSGTEGVYCGGRGMKQRATWPTEVTS